ncbi:SGNH/GDSL hydrolase family protein [Novosphingobium huizhouense]|uniref:SGNH/GDSL hydrolase family protein n=1 Tax=Novosphingobium huizhouense TaxID=2866625 RepID=UPI001CD87680|nr:SGNH/GDSL hydrolase family protein [Novosphingobium huizhouense]
MKRRLVTTVLAAALALSGAGGALARTVLFVGNSFTYGQGSPVRRYHPERVTDLNGEGIGGVPALFRTFAEQTGQDWQVSLETAGGQDLAFHLDKRAGRIDRAWDVVVLQGYSTLDAASPGNPARHVAAALRLAEMMARRNPAVSVRLVSTWPRADLAWRPGSPWSGKPLGALADTVAAANRQAGEGSSRFGPPLPVGAAWMRAVEAGVADPNPYDGTAFGQVDLWTWDQYHASTEGYYLEALVAFGAITGVDPRSLGARERAADDLGMNPAVTVRLQQIAAETLGMASATAPTLRKR